MNTYNGMDAKTAFLEYVLEILHNSLVAKTFATASECMEKLTSLVGAESVGQATSQKFEQAKSAFEQMQKDFAGTDANSFTNQTLCDQLTVVRDLLFEARDEFEKEADHSI